MQHERPEPLTPEQTKRVERLLFRLGRELMNAIRRGDLTDKHEVSMIIYEREHARNIDQLISAGRVLTRLLPPEEAIAALLSVITEITDNLPDVQAKAFWLAILEGAQCRTHSGSMH